MSTRSSGCYVINSDYTVINVNQTAKNIYPKLEVGKKCYNCLMGLNEPCNVCPVAKGVKGPTTYIDPIRRISEIVDAVDIELEGHGLCHMLVFSTVDNEDQIRTTLPTSTEELRALSLIKALTSDYSDVFSVNVKDGGMTLFRLNGKALSADSVYRGTISYAEGIENYIQKYVIQEDQERLRQACALSTLEKDMKEQEVQILHYRVILKGELHYYYRKIVRVESADRLENIVVGIGCEDELVKDREKKAALQTTLRKVELNAATGLLTKEAFFIYGDKILAEHKDRSFDCYLLKIDNLEAIRHQYGPNARKQVIQDVATVLKMYETDTTCTSYVGDGVYTCFIESQAGDNIQGIIINFEEQVQELSAIKNIVFKWTVYKKISGEKSVEETYNRIINVFNTLRNTMKQDFIELDRGVMEQFDWEVSVEQNFTKSLENGEIHVWFQPKYSVHTREIVGAEALARWILPSGEIIPPYKFIPILENSGLINRLDEEVFRQVCIFQKKLKDQNLPQIPISVNLSRASIFTRDIPEVYAEIAERYGVSTSLIPIEITESAAVRASMIDDFAQALIKHGFSIHMDDFGSGYSSLASLQMLPFECIKIDKSLVDFIGRQSGESILKHTIAFAKELGLHVIAEGVEKLEQFMFLKFAGCDSIQGYYFSKPVAEPTFTEMLCNSQNL
ncbi:MAG: GGDEF domain-containing protein [Clostridiales bacterium]|nr:GGDEF domain-containing protein [Candidatus Blautia equi]